MSQNETRTFTDEQAQAMYEALQTLIACKPLITDETVLDAMMAIAPFMEMTVMMAFSHAESALQALAITPAATEPAQTGRYFIVKIDNSYAIAKRDNEGAIVYKATPSYKPEWTINENWALLCTQHEAQAAADALNAAHGNGGL